MAFQRKQKNAVRQQGNFRGGNKSARGQTPYRGDRSKTRPYCPRTSRVSCEQLDMAARMVSNVVNNCIQIEDQSSGGSSASAGGQSTIHGSADGGTRGGFGSYTGGTKTSFGGRGGGNRGGYASRGAKTRGESNSRGGYDRGGPRGGRGYGNRGYGGRGFAGHKQN